MKITNDAMRLRMPDIAKGFQSITFINNPAMLQRNAVAAIARMPAFLFRFSIQYPKPITGDDERAKPREADPRALAWPRSLRKGPAFLSLLLRTSVPQAYVFFKQ